MLSSLVCALSGMAEFLAAVAFSPASTTDQLEHSEDSDGQPEDEQRDEIPPPAAHEAKLLIDLAPVAVVRQRQVQHGDEPVLGRPLVQRVHEWLGVGGRDGQVDRLIVGLCRQDEGVD